MPRITPISVIAGVVSVGDSDTLAGLDEVVPASSALARPKSRTLTVPSGRILTLAGLRSRWTMPRVVRVFQRLGDLPGDRQRLGNRNWSLRDAIGQRRAFDQLHHQRRGAASPLETVDGGDVRVVERREDLGFAPEAREPIGISGHRLGQDLDRHVALQVGVGGAVDLTHSASAELGEDLVGTYSLPDHNPILAWAITS